MSDRQKVLFAWFLFVLIAVSTTAQLIYNLGNQTAGVNWLSYLGVISSGVIPVIFAIVGVLIISRQPNNVIGLLLMLPATMAALPVEIYLEQFSAAPAAPSLLLYLAAWFSMWGWLLAIMPILFILVLFPTGTPFTPRWRWLVYWGSLMSAGFFLAATFAEEFTSNVGEWKITNPIGFLPDEPFFEDYFLPVWYVLLPMLTLFCVGALFVRFRRAGQVQREQIKWLFYGGALFAGMYALSFVNGAISDNRLYSILIDLTLWTIPLAIGIAILRYRLFDIDIIIRKTLLYGLLTVALLAVYFGGVVLAQSAFKALTGEESPIAIVISTLLIAALFNPLRKRSQGFISRRFYRRNYDAAQTLQSFARTARDEVELQALIDTLSTAVQDTMQPQSMSLWLVPERAMNSEQWRSDRVEALQDVSIVTLHRRQDVKLRGI